MLAIIPARGDSKRLPGKNIKSFAGLPLLAHTIQQAQAASKISRVLVSTDDDAIARQARIFGAEVLMRPSALATDTATTAIALQHVVQTLYTQEQYKSEGVVTLQVTNPLRPIGLIDAVIERFLNTPHADAVITVSANHRKLGTIKDEIFTPSFYQTGQRSQDLEQLYFENGLVYVSRFENLRKDAVLFGDKIVPFVTEEWTSLGDIDEAMDFTVAEILFKALIQNKK